MSEVFISYARSTARQARRAAEALRAQGYSVWLDDDLPAHRAYGPEIEQQLTAARAALVIWSAEAAASHWVLSEANRAREAGKLVQLTIDGARLPMPFDQIQCADLSGWSGEGDHPAWDKVEASVADLVRGREARPAAPAASAAARPAAEPLLAVLAFDNLSGDPEMAYFSDGVSEEILQTVARGADLKVIGRASSFLFRGPEKRAARIAAELKATHILDGSVRRAGPRVRISTQLIECAAETTLWSDRYDRDLTDIFALQDEIATSVAAALKTAFARPPAPMLIDPAAFDLFLRARGMEVGAFEGFDLRMKMLAKVVDRAPDFARGWATLALQQAVALRQHRDEAAAIGLTPDQAATAARTALRLDPQMGLAYEALGWLEPFGAYRAHEALSDQALAAAPNDTEVLTQVGYNATIVGRLAEGLSVARRAYQLDPLAQGTTQQLGLQLYTAGALDEAGRLYDAALAARPHSETFARMAIAIAAWQCDRQKLERLALDWSARPLAAPLMMQDAIWFARNVVEPDPDSIRRYFDEQRREVARTGAMPFHLAWRLHALGLADEAFELVERASFAHLFERQGMAPSLGTRQFPGYIFNRCHEAFVRDPRFVRLCAKLGLCDYWLETGKWPDCADEVPYDFRAEARKAAER